MADSVVTGQQTTRNVLTIIGVIMTVIVLSVSISLNAIQANALSQVEQAQSMLQDHEVRIRRNSETLTEIKYMRRQLDRIELQLEDLRKGQGDERINQ